MVSEAEIERAEKVGRAVLILVLVEDGLGAIVFPRVFNSMYRLNPCFSGGWSRSILHAACTEQEQCVLILVLVEDGLGVAVKKHYAKKKAQS